ncbi:MAG TPA: hypothetical protein VFM38_04155, partial [Candidatus Limnocylindrales bacterium]|nr:hypothetical protein [Candidatus Limnocylindrales bacterium]
LQGLAGNAAVTHAIQGRRSGNVVTSVDRIQLTRDAMEPDAGITEIRKHTENKLTIALTKRGIEDTPPIFKPEKPQKGKDGWTTKARSVGAIPEPQLHEYWPKPGLHKIDSGLVDITDKWSSDLEKGEDQHASDATLAWKRTWKETQDRINALSVKEGPPEATEDAAVKALWNRYRSSFKDEFLRPKGDMPTEAAQRDVLAVRPGTDFAHCWETTYVRDSRGYHDATTNGELPEHGHPAPSGANVSGVAGGPQFKVDGPSSEAFLDELREKWRADPGRNITGSPLERQFKGKGDPKD